MLVVQKQPRSPEWHTTRYLVNQRKIIQTVTWKREADAFPIWKELFIKTVWSRNQAAILLFCNKVRPVSTTAFLCPGDNSSVSKGTSYYHWKSSLYAAEEATNCKALWHVCLHQVNYSELRVEYSPQSMSRKNHKITIPFISGERLWILHSHIQPVLGIYLLRWYIFLLSLAIVFLDFSLCSDDTFLTHWLNHTVFFNATS